MEIKEAKEILKERIALIKSDYPEMSDYRNALELAVKAFEKQIPKKPIEDIYERTVLNANGEYAGIDKHLVFLCPTCKDWVGTYDEDTLLVCSKCGQAIDWSEEEENEQINKTNN